MREKERVEFSFTAFLCTRKAFAEVHGPILVLNSVGILLVRNCGQKFPDRIAELYKKEG